MGRRFSSFSGGYAPALFSKPRLRPFTVKTLSRGLGLGAHCSFCSCDVIVSLTGTVDLKTIEPFGLGFICNRSWLIPGCLIHDVWYPSLLF